jgi:chromosome segregation ATPase
MERWAPLFAEHDLLLRERGATAEAAKQERQSFEERLRTAESALHETGRELQEARVHLERSRMEAQEQLTSHAVARGALAERITLLSEKSEEAEKARAREHALSESLVQELRGSVASAMAREQSLNGQKEQLQHALDHAGNQLAESLSENQRLTERLAEAEATHSRCLSEFNATVQSQTSALNAAKAQNLALCEELENLRRRSAERVALLEGERDALQANVAERLQELAQTASMIVERDERITSQEELLRTQASALEGAHARDRLHSDEFEQVRQRSAEQIASLERQRNALQANVDERFRELAQTARMIIARDEKIVEQEESLRTQAAALERGAEQITALERQRAALQANVDERFRELAHMAQIFMHKDMAIEEGRAAAARMKASLSWKATKPLRWLGASFGAGAKEKKRLRRQCVQLEQSGLFDASWYASTYPDVVESGIDPAEHYLRHGAKEGRNPGPRFNTQNYLRRYPDVAKAMPPINPLLHYVLHGKKEGRFA